MNVGTLSRDVLRTALRLLMFRASREELLSAGTPHLAFGLLMTWIVGMGRYWDDPGARPLQKVGVGSLVYVVVLTALLWGIARPMGATALGYRRMLTLVALTSPPAILYAIPVERWVSLALATQLNVAFLALVAAWRVALLVFVLRRVGGLPWIAVAVGSLLPLTFIVTSLAWLNLERAVFEVMGGLRDQTPADAAYVVVLMMSVVSVALFFPLLIAWLGIIVLHYRRTRDGTISVGS